MITSRGIPEDETIQTNMKDRARWSLVSHSSEESDTPTSIYSEGLAGSELLKKMKVLLVSLIAYLPSLQSLPLHDLQSECPLECPLKRVRGGGGGAIFNFKILVNR
jgi:hypothetical protein